MAITLRWNPSEVSHELQEALIALSEHYPIDARTGARQLHFAESAPAGECNVQQTEDEVRITYGAVADALRGVGAALAGLPEMAGTRSEKRNFQTLGIMLDCSRNAVMKVDHLKRWLRCLALMGYNMAMLYTEDTYRLPAEPFFGLFRGAYSPEELKQIDDYATGLGIEVIGCLQTLGHLEQILKWPAYSNVKDTDRELLVGEPATYELIGKMIARYAECLRSRRIHVGMDETWTLGRGRFLDQYGQKPGYDILTEHLGKVVQICRGRGLRPMMWSDMFFKFGGHMHVDYDVRSSIPEEVRNAIPGDLDLVYWDYSSDAAESFLRLIERHRQLGRDPIMGSGLWTWLRLWYGRAEAEATVAPCVSACKQAGLKEIFFTMWGDDGSYCEFDSALAGLAFAAAQCYGEPEALLKARYQAVCGTGYDESLLGSEVEFRPAESRDFWAPDHMAATTLWDDPLLGMHWRSMAVRYPGHWQNALEHYRDLSQRLAGYRKTYEPVDLGHAAALSELLAAKIDFRLRLEDAYRERNDARLQSLLDDLPTLLELVEQLECAFRRQWLRRNKPFGLETLQIRLGGLRQRFVEAGRALQELLDGDREWIPELEEGLSLSEETNRALQLSNRYRGLATPGIL